MEKHHGRSGSPSCGSKKKKGSDYSTRLWMDPWILVIPSRPAKENGNHRDLNRYINQLIYQSTKTWKLDVLHSICDPENIPLIRSIRSSHIFSGNVFCWIYTKSRVYSQIRVHACNKIKRIKWRGISFRNKYKWFQRANMGSIYENFDYILFCTKRNRAPKAMRFPQIICFFFLVSET